MCNYCWANKTHNMNQSINVLKSWDGDEIVTMDVYLRDNELKVMVESDSKSVMCISSTNIKFCPMCGEKLHQHRIRNLFRKIYLKTI